MSDETAPERIVIVWSPEARADIRMIERQTAMQILRSPVFGFDAASTGSFSITQASTQSRSPALEIAKKRTAEDWFRQRDR